MLGPPKPRRLDEPIAVSLEDLIPPSNFYRHLEATLDLSFVRDWTRDLYAERGRPGIDPVIFFKLQRPETRGGERDLKSSLPATPPTEGFFQQLLMALRTTTGG